MRKWRRILKHNYSNSTHRQRYFGQHFKKHTHILEVKIFGIANLRKTQLGRVKITQR